MTFSPYGTNLFGEPINPAANSPLAAEFIAPPMTVLDTRSDRWQDRRRAWINLGIRSELGRPGIVETSINMDWDYASTRRQDADRTTNLTGAPPLPDYARNGMQYMAPGTSIFDPVLCELLYRWYAPPGGHILDPFAGGSVRGIIATLLGHNYTGIELRPEQVDSNNDQADTITPDRRPTWIVGDAYDQIPQLADTYDMIVGCPPYADLEVYSDDPADLSKIAKHDYDAFRDRYRAIIGAAADRTHDDTFAAFVVSEVRNRRGTYHNFVGDTINAFVDAGYAYYNEAVLINAIGTTALRVGKQFRATRKLGRHHQTVLVFVKGDPKAATTKLGDDVTT